MTLFPGWLVDPNLLLLSEDEGVALFYTVGNCMTNFHYEHNVFQPRCLDAEMISSTICHSFLRVLFPSEVRDSHALLNYCECHEVITPTRHVTFAEAEAADILIFCTVVHQLLCTLFADILLIFSFSVFCRYETSPNRYQSTGPTYCLLIGRYVAAAVDSHLAERDRWSPTFPCICMRAKSRKGVQYSLRMRGSHDEKEKGPMAR